MKVPSQAKLGHFNFRAETELTIPTICQKIANFYSYLRTTIKLPDFRPVSCMIIINFRVILMNWCKTKVFIKTFNKKKEIEILARFRPIFHFELNEKRHEPSWGKKPSAPAQLGLITTLQCLNLFVAESNFLKVSFIWYLAYCKPADKIFHSQLLILSFGSNYNSSCNFWAISQVIKILDEKWP